MTTPIAPTLARARAEFEKSIKKVRPDLHRYVAHMIGSVVDAEDVVQEVLAKAYYSLTETISLSKNPVEIYSFFRTIGHLNIDKAMDEALPELFLMLGLVEIDPVKSGLPLSNKPVPRSS